MTKEQLAELRKLAEAVLGWKNCNQAWLDTSEDESAAVVGHITEDGETYPVAVIDCDQYYAGQDSLPLAKLYAASNPSTILQLLDYIETLEKDAGRYRFLRKFLTPKDMPILIGREERDASNESNEIDFIVDATELEVKDWR